MLQLLIRVNHLMVLLLIIHNMAKESDIMETPGDQPTSEEGSGEENNTFEEGSGDANDNISNNKRLLGCSINNITTSGKGVSVFTFEALCTLDCHWGHASTSSSGLVPVQKCFVKLGCTSPC